MWSNNQSDVTVERLRSQTQPSPCGAVRSDRQQVVAETRGKPTSLLGIDRCDRCLCRRGRKPRPTCFASEIAMTMSGGNRARGCVCRGAPASRTQKHIQLKDFHCRCRMWSPSAVTEKELGLGRMRPIACPRIQTGNSHDHGNSGHARLHKGRVDRISMITVKGTWTGRKRADDGRGRNQNSLCPAFVESLASLHDR